MPLLTGANGTVLHQRVLETEAGSDDNRGDSFGHFLVILLDNPLAGTRYDRAGVHRLLLIGPKDRKPHSASANS